MTEIARTIALPGPIQDGGSSFERSLASRRSVRRYAPDAVPIAGVSQLLFAAQGVTGENGLRAAPSAGALYPLELYLVTGRVRGLGTGVFRYLPEIHGLDVVTAADKREAIAACARGQDWIADSALVLVFAAVSRRATRRYGSRGERYIAIEVGHAAQNVLLQAQALGLGAAVVGAFEEEGVKRALQGAREEVPIYLVPVGIEAGAAAAAPI